MGGEGVRRRRVVAVWRRWRRDADPWESEGEGEGGGASVSDKVRDERDAGRKGSAAARGVSGGAVVGAGGGGGLGVSRGRLEWMGVRPPLGSSAAGGVRARVSAGRRPGLLAVPGRGFCWPGLACLLFRLAWFLLCSCSCRGLRSHRGLWARGISGSAICAGLVTSAAVS